MSSNQGIISNQNRKLYVYVRDSHVERYHIVEVTLTPENAEYEYMANRVAEVFSEEIAAKIARGLTIVSQQTLFQGTYQNQELKLDDI